MIHERRPVGIRQGRRSRQRVIALLQSKVLSVLLCILLSACSTTRMYLPDTFIGNSEMYEVPRHMLGGKIDTLQAQTIKLEDKASLASTKPDQKIDTPLGSLFDLVSIGPLADVLPGRNYRVMHDKQSALEFACYPNIAYDSLTDVIKEKIRNVGTAGSIPQSGLSLCLIANPERVADTGHILVLRNDLGPNGVSSGILLGKSGFWELRHTTQVSGADRVALVDLGMVTGYRIEADEKLIAALNVINGNQILFEKNLSDDVRMLFFAVFNIVQDANYRPLRTGPAPFPYMRDRKEAEALYEKQGKILR